MFKSLFKSAEGKDVQGDGGIGSIGCYNPFPKFTCSDANRNLWHTILCPRCFPMAVDFIS